MITLTNQQIAELPINPFHRIGHDWMLVTAGSIDRYNMMTASWGSMGVLWKRMICTVFIRPQRYTFHFAETSPIFTISFFSSRYKPALTICGTISGRDGDKAGKAGLSPIATPAGGVGFIQAELTIECRKLYADDLRESCFVLPVHEEVYPEKDFHRFYIGEVTGGLGADR